jgi:hypothetical protein
VDRGPDRRGHQGYRRSVVAGSVYGGDRSEVHGAEGFQQGIFALAFGLYTSVNPVPNVTGGPDLVKLLTRTCPGLPEGS